VEPTFVTIREKSFIKSAESLPNSRSGEKLMRVVVLLLVLALSSGCLEWEEMDIRVLREGGEPSVFVMEITNFYSTENERAGINKDFEQLIQQSLGDGAARDSAEDGIQLKGRELFIRDGKIVYRQVGIMNVLTNKEFQVKDSDITWAMDGNDEIVETNGKVVTLGTRTIFWPKDAKEMRVRLRHPLKDAYQTSQPQMVERLKDYLASRSDK
jgi:hypothetical protein